MQGEVIGPARFIDRKGRVQVFLAKTVDQHIGCLLYTSPSPRDRTRYRMPSSAWKKKAVEHGTTDE